jgi:hypothetical protein
MEGLEGMNTKETTTIEISTAIKQCTTKHNAGTPRGEV